MNMKNSFFLIGIINIIEGLIGFSTGSVFIRRWHEITLFEAFIWLFSGIIFILISLKFFKRIEYSKCPKCKESFTYSELEEGVCPTCYIKTIDMEKYYDKK